MGSAEQLGAARRRGTRTIAHPPVKAWALIVLAGLCRCALLTGVALISWTVIPGLVGFDATTVMSGSMTPRFQVGDAVIAKPVARADLAVGQVLLFDDPDETGALRLHRLVRARGDRLVTRGDANGSNDSSRIGFSAVHGVGFLRIPHAGLPTYWVRTGQVQPLVLCGAVAVALMWGSRLDRRFTTGRHIDDSGDGARRRARHRWVATAPVILVLALCGALVTHDAAPAAARFSTRTSNPTSSYTGCWDWPLRGTLPASAVAYFNYMETSGTTTVNRAGAAWTANVFSSPAFGNAIWGSGTCVKDGSPYLHLDSAAASGAVVPTRTTMPPDVTIATWFRASRANPGGTLAAFGSSGTSAASGSLDRALYMADDGSIRSAAITLAVGGINLGMLACQTPSGYANGSWHLVVARFSTSSGCSIAIDRVAPVAGSAAVNSGGSLKVLSGTSGFWRIGYDNIASVPANPALNYFRGDIDETQVYSTLLSTSEQTAIFDRGH